jgi:hypothetical protein
LFTSDEDERRPWSKIFPRILPNPDERKNSRLVVSPCKGFRLGFGTTNRRIAAYISARGAGEAASTMPGGKFTVHMLALAPMVSVGRGFRSMQRVRRHTHPRQTNVRTTKDDDACEHTGCTRSLALHGTVGVGPVHAPQPRRDTARRRSNGTDPTSRIAAKQQGLCLLFFSAAPEHECTRTDKYCTDQAETIRMNKRGVEEGTKDGSIRQPLRAEAAAVGRRRH